MTLALAIVDYGTGNLGSILNMLRKLGVQATLTSNPLEIQRAEKLILPGVGAFDNMMAGLSRLGVIEILNERVLQRKVPILGICLGMQVFTSGSEEGALPGLGWLRGFTRRFSYGPELKHLKIPHMGWNQARARKDSALFRGFAEIPRFYFVHSYYVACENQEDVLSMSDYGSEFTSAVERDNIFGVQFHPEKSHKFGLKVLNNFVSYC